MCASEGGCCIVGICRANVRDADSEGGCCRNL